MSALYDFWKKSSKLSDGEKTDYIPRVVSKGMIRTERMIRLIHKASTLQKSEVKAALDALTEEIIDHLKEGYTVELGDIGYLSLKLKSRPVTDKSTIHGQSIFVETIKFRPSKKFLKEFTSTSFERAPEGFHYSKESSIEQRKKVLETYLSKHPFITRTDYCRFTGLLKTKALNELNRWVKEKYLVKRGQRPHIVFMKNPDFTGESKVRAGESW